VRLFSQVAAIRGLATSFKRLRNLVLQKIAENFLDETQENEWILKLLKITIYGKGVIVKDAILRSCKEVHVQQSN